MFTLNGSAVSWKSFKHTTIADSMTKVEYIIKSDAAKEVVWLKKFIIGIGLILSISYPTPLWCDNNNTIS